MFSFSLDIDPLTAGAYSSNLTAVFLVGLSGAGLNKAASDSHC
jgi:hypothetical protein